MNLSITIKDESIFKKTIFLTRNFTDQKKKKKVWEKIATEFTYCVFNKLFFKNF